MLKFLNKWNKLRNDKGDNNFLSFINKREKFATGRCMS